VTGDANARRVTGDENVKMVTGDEYAKMVIGNVDEKTVTQNVDAKKMKNTKNTKKVTSSCGYRRQYSHRLVTNPTCGARSNLIALSVLCVPGPQREGRLTIILYPHHLNLMFILEIIPFNLPMRPTLRSRFKLKFLKKPITATIINCDIRM